MTLEHVSCFERLSNHQRPLFVTVSLNQLELKERIARHVFVEYYYVII